MKSLFVRRAQAGFGIALSIMVIASGLVGAFALPASVSAAEAVTNADVNLRSGPGEGYEVLMVVPTGGAITVDGDAVDGYAPVTYNGVSGWLSVGYIVAAGTAPVSGYQTTLEDGTVVTVVNGEEVVYSNDSGATRESRRDRNGNGTTSESTGTVTTTTTDGTVPAAPVTTGTTTTPEGAVPNPGVAAGTEQDIISIIHQAAAAYGQNPDDMVRVARCESNLNPRAVDPSGSYHGLFQFVPSTFAGTPYGGQDIYDPWANAHAAAWMWAQGRKSEWVCQ